jgi:predicted acyltransferase
MEKTEEKTRLLSLDVFRGMTVAGMILVNNPGTWSAIYAPLRHAEWHGATPTDFVFPFFLFIVGVAIALALGRRVASGAVSKEIYIKIFRRAAIIFLLGLFLAAFPYFDLATLRIPGVLQRIAVCYLIAAVLFLHFDWKKLTVISAALLFIYWLLMTLVPVPGCVAASLDDRACNPAAYLDRLFLTEAHMWKQSKVFDPEGILSTMPAVVTTISGILAGLWLKKDRPEYEKAAGLLSFGVALTALGWCWGFFFPINKSLWTSSYVVYTSGLALCFLGFCYWTVDIKGYRKWTKPFVIFGVNALALFVGSGLMAKTLGLIKVAGPDGKSISLQKWIFDNVFAPLAAPINASLMYALCFILVWLFLMWLLYRKRIFIKI